MDQCWYENEVGQSDGYVHNQGWLTTPHQQEDQQNWHDADNWHNGPYDDEANGFDDFESPRYDGLLSPDKVVKEEAEDTKSGNGYQALIRNEAHYYMENNSRVRADLHEKKADGAVSGAPIDDEMKRYWVGRLFDAFKNTIGIKDKNCKNGKPAQSAQRLASDYYPDKEIEMVCWQIFLACSDSQYGVKLVESHHHTKWETNDVHKNFEDRMEKIIEVCKSSKAMCKQLLDPPYYKRLVDAPGFEASLKENNKRINSERDVQNEIGRKAMKKGIDLATLPDIKTEIEDEEDENARTTADSGPQNTKTPKGRRILQAKRRSSSATASSKKGVSSVQSPVTPVSTGKRKQRSMTSKNYREEDNNEEEDSDGSEYEDNDTPTQSTPSKRAATRASRAKFATSSRTTPSRTTPSRTRATPSKAASKGASNSLPVRNQATRGSAVGHRNRRSTLSSVVHASNLEDEEKMKYKEIVCDILQVNRALAQSYSLKDLRFYARAYNIQFAGDDWFLGTADDATGKMFRIFTGSGIIHHFAQILPHFVVLAVERGDLNPDKTVNEHSPHMVGFATNGDVQKDMALGVLPNPFGLHDQLWNLAPQ